MLLGCPYVDYAKIHFSSLTTKHFQREHASPDNNGTTWCAANDQTGYFLQLYFKDLAYGKYYACRGLEKTRAYVRFKIRVGVFYRR